MTDETEPPVASPAADPTASLPDADVESIASKPTAKVWAGDPRVALSKGRARPAWAGHPNVYEGAIEKVDGEPADGDEVDVVDSSGRFIGRGVWGGASALRVRILRNTRGPVDAAFVARRVRQAVALRRDVLQLAAVTDAWRLIHGDGDRLPGVVADRYGDWVVLQVTNRPMADRRPALAKALLDAAGVKGVWERAAPKFAEREGFHPGGGRLAGETPPDAVVIQEHGLRFNVDLVKGQKTGHFLDQRDNRLRFGAFTKGRRVLDAFSGTGAFSIAALTQGATSALALDSSARVLERAAENATLNDCAERLESRAGDAFTALRELEEAGEKFGAVSLDPPRFASSQREVSGALRGYLEVNTRGVALVEPGGILATSSCTGAVSESDFLRMLRDAAFRARRRIQILAVTGQAPDHPWLTAVPEGRYLKHVLARVL